MQCDWRQTLALSLCCLLPAGAVRADFSAHEAALDIGQLIEDCREALQAPDPAAEVAAVLRRALANPRAAVLALGEPNQSGYEPIYRSDTLTIVNAGWRPGLNLPPHNHGLWSVTAVYTGEEQNWFWEAVEGGLGQRGSRLLRAGDVLQLQPQAIHSVGNPGNTYTGALQVYGGDFLSVRFQRWDPESHRMEQTDGESERLRFKDDNRRHPVER